MDSLGARHASEDPYTSTSSKPTSTSVVSEDRDKFKASFKKFKQNFDPSDCGAEVFDGDRLPKVSERSQYEVISPLRLPTCQDQESCSCQQSFPGLRPFSEWTVVRFRFPEGLIFIQNPFTPCGQQYWISKCVHDYPNTKSHVTNVNNLIAKGGATDQWKESDGNDLFKKLRWITFGYHHNWDTKVYSEDSKCKFPDDLAELTKYLSLVLGFKDFCAEAAIVNYYNMDSTLSGHQDRSEDFQDAPLFSISFGQSAIFLIGGDTKEIEPLSIYLRSGDIVVMSGKSRKSYHAVPKVIPTNSTELPPWSLDKISSRNSSENVTPEYEEETDEPSTKRSKGMPNIEKSQSDCTLCPFLNCDLTLKNKSQYSVVLDKWKSDNFLNTYILQHRINLNVRQVLYPGQSTLKNRADEKS